MDPHEFPHPEISRHAEERIHQMGLTPDEVFEAVADPEVTMPNGPGYPRGWRFARGPIVAVVAADDHRLMTVLWRGAAGRTPDGGPEWGFAA